MGRNKMGRQIRFKHYSATIRGEGPGKWGWFIHSYKKTLPRDRFLTAGIPYYLNSEADAIICAMMACMWVGNRELAEEILHGEGG